MVTCIVTNSTNIGVFFKLEGRDTQTAGVPQNMITVMLSSNIFYPSNEYVLICIKLLIFIFFKSHKNEGNVSDFSIRKVFLLL